MPLFSFESMIKILERKIVSLWSNDFTTNDVSNALKFFKLWWILEKKKFH